MSLVDVDSWSTEYEGIINLNHKLIANLTQREKRQRLSPEYNKLSAEIQIGINQFETELQQLKSKLDGAARSRTISFEEIERRQRQIDNLQSQMQQQKTKYTSSTREDRLSLLDQQSSNSMSLWQSSNSGASKPNNDSITKPANNNDLESMKRQQIDILEEQNRGLETLAQTLTRQRALATQLGEEVEDQNEILDNLATTMDRVDTRVHIETGNVAQINRQDSTWGYWIVIVVLLVAIIIVALI